MMGGRSYLGGSRLRQLGWFVTLALCGALLVALTFKVNSVRSEVRLAERQILSLQREKVLLETEFETRASQQQLAQWNAVDFGYQAPGPGQYLEGERQLAALGEPRALAAPTPIRVARAEDAVGEAHFPAMVSPLTGKPVGPVDESRSLADKLAHGGAVFRSGITALREIALHDRVGRGAAAGGSRNHGVKDFDGRLQACRVTHQRVG